MTETKKSRPQKEARHPGSPPEPYTIWICHAPVLHQPTTTPSSPGRMLVLPLFARARRRSPTLSQQKKKEGEPTTATARALSLAQDRVGDCPSRERRRPGIDWLVTHRRFCLVRRARGPPLTRGPTGVRWLVCRVAARAWAASACLSGWRLGWMVEEEHVTRWADADLASRAYPRGLSRHPGERKGERRRRKDACICPCRPPKPHRIASKQHLVARARDWLPRNGPPRPCRCPPLQERQTPCHLPTNESCSTKQREKHPHRQPLAQGPQPPLKPAQPIAVAAADATGTRPPRGLRLVSKVPARENDVVACAR